MILEDAVGTVAGEITDSLNLQPSPPPTNFQQQEMQYNGPQPMDVGQLQAQAAQYPDIGQIQAAASRGITLPGWGPRATAGQPSIIPFDPNQALSAPVPSTYQSPFGSPAPDYSNQSFLGAGAAIANLPFQATAPITKALTSPLTNRIDQALPQGLQGPAEMVGNMAAGAPAMLIPGVGTAAYAGMGLQGADVLQQVIQGKMSVSDAVKTLGPQAGMIAIGEGLRLGIPAVRQYLQSPEGQAVVARARTLPSAEAGGGTFGEKPPVGPEARGLPASDQLPAPPESLASRLGPTAAEREVGTARENTGRAAVGLENITRASGQVAQDAIAQGAKPDLAQLLQQTMDATAARTPETFDPLLAAGRAKQTLSKWASRITGSLPGYFGTMVDEAQRMKLALIADSQNTLKSLGRQVDTAIKGDMANLQFVGKDASKVAAATSPESYVFEFPQDFAGLSQQTAQLIDQLKQAQQGHFALLQAIDPTTAKSVESYLPHLYETARNQPLGPLETRVPYQRGEVKVAQARQFQDWRIAVDKGATMQKMPFLQHLETGFQQADQGVYDALLRKGVLEKFGTTDPQAAKDAGFVAVTNKIFTRPEEGPWYVPRPVANFIDQHYAPSALPPMVRNISSRLKGIAIFPMDIGGLAQRIRELGVMNPVSLGTGMMHRIMTEPAAGQVARDLQYARDGIPQGNAGSIMSESTLPFSKGRLGMKFAEANKAPWQVLTYFRNLSHEGNLAIMQTLGMDVNPATAAGMANREASAAWVRATSGASLGAQTVGRNALEQSLMLSQQNTRALFSQIGSVANLLRPTANAGQRLMAAQGLASMAIGVWGMGSVLNMTIGDGNPLKFPVSWTGSGFKYNSDWDMVKVGDTSTPLLPQASLVNAFAKAFTVLGTTAVSPPTSYTGAANQLGEAVKPFAQFGLGRLSPGAEVPFAAMGYGYDTSGRPHFGDMPAGERLAAMTPQPIAVSKFTQSPLGWSPTDIAKFGAEQVLGTYPPFPSPSARTTLTKANQQLISAGMPTADSGNWKNYFKPLGPTNADNFDAFRQNYLDYFTKQFQAKGLALGQARQKASDQWSREPLVKRYNADLQQAILAWIKAHPDEFKKAVAAGREPTKAESQAAGMR